MSALSTLHPARGAAPPGAAGPSWRARLVHAIAEEYRVRRAVAEMAALDARHLRDIGLDRGGIEYAVRFGRG